MKILINQTQAQEFGMQLEITFSISQFVYFRDLVEFFHRDFWLVNLSVKKYIKTVVFFCDVWMVRAFSKSIIYEPFYCRINNFSKFFVSHRWSILSSSSHRQPLLLGRWSGTIVRKIHKKNTGASWINFPRDIAAIIWTSKTMMRTERIFGWGFSFENLILKAKFFFKQEK
jgi:hypothetical protein